MKNEHWQKNEGGFQSGGPKYEKDTQNSMMIQNGFQWISADRSIQPISKIDKLNMKLAHAIAIGNKDAYHNHLQKMVNYIRNMVIDLS